MAITGTGYDVRTYLIGLGIVGDAADSQVTGWPCFIGAMAALPDTPDKAVLIAVVGGAPMLSAAQLINGAFQVVVRGPTWGQSGQDIEQKAREILSTLNLVNQQAIAGATTYQMIRAVNSEPVAGGPDGEDREFWTANFITIRDEQS